LRDVYRYDAEAEERGLTPEERLRLHQEHSQPVMDALQAWFWDYHKCERSENQPTGIEAYLVASWM
jgi:hypothetical protein